LTKAGQSVRNDLITGKPGGQTVSGGIDSKESLVLSSTTSATKGAIYFGNSLSRYNEASDRLGIGINPTAKIHVRAGQSTAGNAAFKMTLGSDQPKPEIGAFYFTQIATINRLGMSLDGSSIRRIAFTNDVAPANGGIPIGNGTDYTVAGITGSNTILVTNGPGSIALNADTTFLATQSDLARTGTKTALVASGNGISTAISISLPAVASWVMVGAGNGASAGISYWTLAGTILTINYNLPPPAGTDNLEYWVEYR
jgi:hypothetical protein